jgi:hypothetical protein
MYSRAQIPALAVSLTLGTLISATAQAQVPPLPPPFNNYGAKFVCGKRAADADVLTGTYATTINIHNPQATVQVPFVKKIVVAKQEGQPFVPPFSKKDNLPPDAAEYVDCPLIYRITGIAPGTPIEGFVVLEIPPVALSTGAKVPVLDVVGKYTARGATTTAVSLEIVTYSATLITF